MVTHIQILLNVLLNSRANERFTFTAWKRRTLASARVYQNKIIKRGQNGMQELPKKRVKGSNTHQNSK